MADISTMDFCEVERARDGAVVAVFRGCCPDCPQVHEAYMSKDALQRAIAWSKERGQPAYKLERALYEVEREEAKDDWSETLLYDPRYDP